MSRLGLLPDELQQWCANHLDQPSAGRFAAANRACARAVRVRLEELKLVHVAAEAARREAANREAAPRHRITFTVAGKAFIDTYLDLWIVASPSERKVLVGQVLQAAALNEELGSANWSPQSVVSRLKNAVLRATRLPERCEH